LQQGISLAVSELNQCNYCLAAHTFLGRKAGLSETDVLDARHGTSSDKKTEAALEFARKISQDRGHVNNQDVDDVRQAGYTEGEIAEIIASVALITFTNYFNIVADTAIDFPRAPSLAAV
jgi:AhpD family alkylhydroperoxidase